MRAIQGILIEGEGSVLSSSEELLLRCIEPSPSVRVPWHNRFSEARTQISFWLARED